jgi:hypothetical protein
MAPAGVRGNLLRPVKELGRLAVTRSGAPVSLAFNLNLGRV